MKYSLNEILNIIGGGTPKTSVKEYWNGTIPWLSIADFASKTKYVYKTEKSITEEGLNNSSTKLLKPKDIIISARGTVGELAMIPFNMAFNQSCYGLRAKTDIVDADYLYYLIKNEIHVLKHDTHGSVFDTITKDTFSNIIVNIPEMKLQRRIADFMSSIDEKIEINESINDNLQLQAEALYKNYYEKVSCDSGTLTLDRFCNIFTGKKNSNANVVNGKYKFFTCSPKPLQIDSYIYDGDAIIVSGNGAYTGRTRFYTGRFDLYQRTYACTLKNGLTKDYLFPLYWFVKFNLSKKIMGGTRGSAIPYIVMNDLAKYEIPFDKELFEKNLDIFKSITIRIQENENQNERLSELRDALLPKLMSGEIDVSNIKLDL